MQVEDGSSLDSQRDRIKRYCDYKKYELKYIYSDEGLSGGKIDRPALQQMLNDIKKDDIIITISITRLSRSIRDCISILDQIKDKGASIVFLDIDIDTRTASGALLLNIMMCLSEFERQQISDRVSQTMTSMSRANQLKAKPKFGYKLVKDENNNSSYEVCDEEMKVINYIRSLIDEDSKITITEICRKIQDKGYKMRKSRIIYPCFVSKIIKDNELR